MSLLQIVVLALVQGITEFLPISSSGHLILVPYLTDWPDQGVLIDVAVHVGTLFAVMLYFWRDLAALLRGLIVWREAEQEARQARRLLAQLLVATVPVVLAGLALAAIGPESLRSVAVIGWTMLGFGIVLWLADRFGPKLYDLQRLTLGHALIVGLAQALALIPGTSRAGITMTAARALGYRRDEAARFSMLLSIPAILAAGAVATLDLLAAETTQAQVNDALLAALLAFASALVAIWLLMRWLKVASFTPFVLYRVVLGLLLLGFAYGVV